MARELPLYPTIESINCGNCVAACCEDATLRLSAAEKTFLEQAGTELEPKNPPRNVYTGERVGSLRDRLRERFFGDGYYQIVGKCALLTENNTCSAYRQSERPEACGDLDVGGYGCRQIRANAGVDSQDQFAQWRLRTES